MAAVLAARPPPPARRARPGHSQGWASIARAAALGARACCRMAGCNASAWVRWSCAPPGGTRGRRWPPRVRGGCRCCRRPLPRLAGQRVARQHNVTQLPPLCCGCASGAHYWAGTAGQPPLRFRCRHSRRAIACGPPALNAPAGWADPAEIMQCVGAGVGAPCQPAGRPPPLFCTVCPGPMCYDSNSRRIHAAASHFVCDPPPRPQRPPSQCSASMHTSTPSGPHSKQSTFDMHPMPSPPPPTPHTHTIPMPAGRRRQRRAPVAARCACARPPAAVTARVGICGAGGCGRLRWWAGARVLAAPGRRPRAGPGPCCMQWLPLAVFAVARTGCRVVVWCPVWCSGACAGAAARPSGMRRVWAVLWCVCFAGVGGWAR